MQQHQVDYTRNYKLGDRPRSYVLPYIPPGSEVLDVGCYTGATAEIIRNEKNCRVTGIDFCEDALAVAASRLDEVHRCDLEDPGAISVIETNRFDVILLLSVLEHLRHPDRFLSSLRLLLKDGGRIIIALPNICFWRSRLRLLRGIFHYKQQGLFDEGHLRFFSLDSARSMVVREGFQIEDEIYFVRLPLEKAVRSALWHLHRSAVRAFNLLFRGNRPLPPKRYPRRMQENTLGGVGRVRPNLLAWKFVLVCRAGASETPPSE